MKQILLICSLLLLSSRLAIAQGLSVSVETSVATSMHLSREEAEQLALRNNPRVSVSHLLALAQHQVVRESRAAELPTLTGSITAEAADDGSRVASGSLSDSRLFQHAGGGVAFSQLITDFGHTSNLVSSSQLLEQAQNANEQATREDIVLITDQAFYSVLQAQALLKVALQTVTTRGATQQQINQLTQNNLRSTLDLSFANVNLSQARLLQLDAASNVDATLAVLNEILGLDHEVAYTLVEANDGPPPPPPDVDVLVQLAISQRPDLQSLAYSRQAEQKLSRAQADQRLPSITALGTVGSVPVRPGQYFTSSWDGGIAANINIPIFNGFLYSAQAKETSLRTRAMSNQEKELRNRIVREVHTAWLDANSAFRRIDVTAELLHQSDQAASLAQTRYKLGLSSIVELSQAQLQQTQANISHANAEYQYKLSLAILNLRIGSKE